jgi:AhpD family alkylhydroperoxidase
MDRSYPEYRKELQDLMGKLRRQIPGALAKFGQLHGETMKEGALNVKQKELIALGIAIAVRCDGCIAFHVHEALAAGAAKQEIAECFGVAILMGGGPSTIYGAQALEAVEQFESVEQFQSGEVMQV